MVLAFGVAVAAWVGSSALARGGFRRERGLLLILSCAFAGLVTGRVSHQAERWLIGGGVGGPSWDGLAREAGSYHVGILFGLLAGWWLGRRLAIPRWLAFDAIAVASAAGQGVGRIGCLFAGCCWGCDTSGPFGLSYPVAGTLNTGVPHGIPLHPVALYEALWLLFVAGLLWRVPWFALRPGRRSVLYLAAWGAGRFWLEFLRAEPRVHVGPFSSAQIVALVLTCLAAVLWLALPGPDPSRPTNPYPLEH